jgi:hypothetical protein
MFDPHLYDDRTEEERQRDALGCIVWAVLIIVVFGLIGLR